MAIFKTHVIQVRIPKDWESNLLNAGSYFGLNNISEVVRDALRDYQKKYLNEKTSSKQKVPEYEDISSNDDGKCWKKKDTNSKTLTEIEA